MKPRDAKSVVEHRTTDDAYDHHPTSSEIAADVMHANSLGRVTSWRVIKVADPTAKYGWAVRIHYDRKVTT